MWGLKRLRVGPTSCFQAVKTKLSHRTLKQRHELGSNRVFYTYMHNFLIKCATEGYIHRVSHNWKRNFESQNFPSLSISFLLRFYQNVFIFAHTGCFPSFFTILRGKSARGRLKLILWRMPDVWLLYYHIFKGSGAWIHLLLVSIKYVQPNWKTLSDWYKWK